MFIRPPSGNPRAGCNWLADYSLVVRMTAAVVVILAITLAGVFWWSGHQHQKLIQDLRSQQVKTLSSDLIHTSKVFLGNDNLRHVKQLVRDFSARHQLTQCRLILPNGVILADAHGASRVEAVLPDSWPSGPYTHSIPVEVHDGTVDIQVAFDVTGRGPVVLQVSALVTGNQNLTLQAFFGYAGIILIAVFLLLLWGRYLLAPLRSIETIRHALLALDSGEKSYSVLAIHNQSTPEVNGWNRIIGNILKLEETAIERNSQQSLLVSRKSTAGLEGACDAMWHGVILLDNKLCAKYANGAAAVLLGMQRGEIISNKLPTFIAQEDILKAVKETIDGSSLQRKVFEHQLQSNDTEAGQLRISVRPVRREDPGSVIMIIEDITQLRAAEDARHSFIAQATHELRMPLTNICLYVEEALENDDTNLELHAKCLNVINQEAHRLERVVGEMLSVAQIESGVLEIERDDVPIGSLIKELENDYQVQAQEKQVQLTFHQSPKLPTLYGDRDKIALALHNLLGNAIKYTTSNGQVDVRIDGDENFFAVVIEDTGIGIDPNDLEHIFEKFYRGKDSRISKIAGSGLGLALAREVMRLHGGDIVAESKIDEGSKFTLTMPLKAEVA